MVVVGKAVIVGVVLHRLSVSTNNFICCEAMTQKSNTYEVPATMDVRSVDFDPGSSKEIEPDEDVLESEV